MSLISSRFTTSITQAAADRLDRASRNNPPIQIGEMVHDATTAIQQALNDLNDPRINCGKVDGIFGQKTAAAVSQFQLAYGLAVDGIAGSEVIAKLDSLYSDEYGWAPRGISIHIGLNSVDPVHYQGWDGALGGCEPDALDMKELAESKGFSTSLILTRDATSSRLFSELRVAASMLKGGDILFLTYSGHGGQIADTNGDEESDGDDETWCMYDREVCDDELFAAFTRFAPGVRILMLSDSCHSGTVTRSRERIKYRVLPLEIGESTYKANKAMYDALQDVLLPSSRANVSATVLLISGCQDYQLSGDTGTNGVFTNAVKAIWAGGAFNGSYRKFHKSVQQIMPPNQQPNLFVYGSDNEGFLKQRPFSI